MKKSLLILFGLLCFISCKENKNPDSSGSKPGQMEKTNETELVVQKILDLPDLQWVYHPELKERLPVKVLKTEQITEKLDLKKFGRKVSILSPEELEKEHITDYVSIQLDFSNDTLKFDLEYKAEGAVASGKMVKKNGEWIVVDYSVAEE